MSYFQFERAARENEVKVWDYKSGTVSGFWTKVFYKHSESKDVEKDYSTKIGKFQFVADIESDFQLRASGYVAEILNTVVIPGRHYFLSGVNVVSDKTIEVPLYSEMSRVKSEGILHEKIVDIKYLAEMQKNRSVYAEIWEHLETERYYVRAAIVNATEDARSNLYKGCQHPDCHAAKVLPECDEDGIIKYRCTKCGFMNPKFERRAMPKLDLVDPKDVLNATAESVTAAIFKGSAETLFEVFEKEMVRILEEEGEQHFAEVFNRRYGIMAVLRLKANEFQGSVSFKVDEIFFD